MIVNNSEDLKSAQLSCIVEVKTTKKLALTGTFDAKLYVTELNLADSVIILNISTAPMPLSNASLKCYYTTLCSVKDELKLQEIIQESLNKEFKVVNSDERLEVARLLDIKSEEIFSIDVTIMEVDYLSIFNDSKRLGTVVLENQHILIFNDPTTGVQYAVCGAYYDEEGSFESKGDLYLLNLQEMRHKNSLVQCFRFSQTPKLTSVVYRNPLIKTEMVNGDFERSNILDPANWLTINVSSFMTSKAVSSLKECLKLQTVE